MADLSYFTLVEHTTRLDANTAATYVDALAATTGTARLTVTHLGNAVSGLLEDAHQLARIFLDDGENPDVFHDWALTAEQRDQVLTLIETSAHNVALFAAELRRRMTPDSRRPGHDPLN